MNREKHNFLSRLSGRPSVGSRRRHNEDCVHGSDRGRIEYTISKDATKNDICKGKFTALQRRSLPGAQRVRDKSQTHAALTPDSKIQEKRPRLEEARSHPPTNQGSGQHASTLLDGMRPVADRNNWNHSLKEIDADEEAYFNGSDDEHEISSSHFRPGHGSSSHEVNTATMLKSQNSSYQYQRPPTSGYHPGLAPVFSNVHNPSGQMSLVGVHPGMMPGFNSGHATTMPYSFSNFFSGQPSITDRLFKCDECSQSFDRNHDLKRHKRIHLSVKPFPCNHCSKSFSRKDALKASKGPDFDTRSHLIYEQRHILVKGCGKIAATNENNHSPFPDIDF